MLSGFRSLKGSASHLTPGGAPNRVGGPVARVETLSTIIRPITLRFRLRANIRAGHVIIAIITRRLLFTTVRSKHIGLNIALLAVVVGYTTFELGIRLAQAYVFTLLASIYSNDISNRV